MLWSILCSTFLHSYLFFEGLTDLRIYRWHGTILARMAVVPQRLINGYVEESVKEGTYADGDFVANFHGCNARVDEDGAAKKKKVSGMTTTNRCEEEQASLLRRWREMVDREGR